ncbi:H-NS family nucleoid-associated regulatory protein [Lysobacter sp. 22409]|uniref:H-NS family nucleoid-associated regulatory protein n=1 Tax=Lysobacter sp. 22409 TaxID=3453917 RepID=UPI003F860036
MIVRLFRHWRRISPQLAAKYRDPESPRNTWSGRGRIARWLAEKTKYCRSDTDFLIPGLGRPTARKSSSIGKNNRQTGLAQSSPSRSAKRFRFAGA